MFDSMQAVDWPVAPAEEPAPLPDGAAWARLVDAELVFEGDCLDPALLTIEAAAWWAAEQVERRHHRERLEDADPDTVLGVAATTQRQINLAEADQLAQAAHWADLHDRLAYPSGTPGSEELVRFGGSGTPRVAEFCPAELGAALGLSVGAARSLVADALDLRHRLPLLWQAVQTGTVRVWVARKAASRTRRLSRAAARTVDRTISPVAATLPPGRLFKTLDAAILAADPPLAQDDADQAAAGRGFWISHEILSGQIDVHGRLDAPDATALDHTLDTIARALTTLGDTDGYDIRRAKALGLLATPTTVLDLIDRANQTLTTQTNPNDSTDADAPADDAHDDAAAGDAGGDGGLVPVERLAGTDPGRGFDLTPATLYVHVSMRTLADQFGISRVEDLGPILLTTLHRWLQHRHVAVKPVIDLPTMPAYDCYEVPDRLSEAVWLAKPADHFPHSPTITRHHTDNEHTIPHVARTDGGPPGQTNLANLGRITRHPHRIKTHGRWRVTQPRPGTWIWRTPHGRYYLVDHTGTTPLGKLWND